MINFSSENLVAQVVGLIASALIITGFAHKGDNRFKLFMTLGAFTFACHYFLLEAYAGAAANIISASRTGLSVKFHKSNRMMIFFIFLYILLGALSVKTLSDVLPIFSGILATIAMYRLSGIKMRLCFFVSSTSWLIYDFIYKSIGGIITESFVQFTNVTTIYRLLQDKKKALT